MSATGPVMLIGLDAVEISLVESLCAAGQLPTLSALRDRGCFGALESSAALFPGAVWSTFCSGREVPWHGIYHNRLWCPDTMRSELVDRSRYPVTPFWSEPTGGLPRVVLVDLPVRTLEPAVDNTVLLSGWATHDQLIRASRPGDLSQRLQREFGPPAMPAERYGRQSVGGLLEQRAGLLEATEQLTGIGLDLLRREPFDLFVLVFGAAHRAGHYLWDCSQVEGDPHLEAQRQTLEKSVPEIYQALDRAVGRLLEGAPSGAQILVFSLHGMARNSGWSDYCAEILEWLEGSEDPPPRASRFVRRIDRLLPRDLVRAVTYRLPQRLQDYLVSGWYSRMQAHEAQRALAMPMDQAGYIRINLRGREAAGLVEPGSDYEALCRRLTEDFLDLRDLRTGEAVVARVVPLEQLGPPGAPFGALFPDLVLLWSELSAIGSPGVRSSRRGELRWPSPARLRSGRSGNHRPHGWFVGAGDEIAPGGRTGPHQLVDLGPTILQWLGAAQPSGLQGSPIPALCPP